MASTCLYVSDFETAREEFPKAYGLQVELINDTDFDNHQFVRVVGRQDAIENLMNDMGL